MDQFHALTSLLHLVQTVNSDKSVENTQRKCCSGDRDKSDLTMMDAISSILMQRHEVNIVAASFQDLDKVSVVVATTNPTTAEEGKMI